MDCIEEVSVLKRTLLPYVREEECLLFDLLQGKLTIKDENHRFEQNHLVRLIHQAGLKSDSWDDYKKNMHQPKSFCKKHVRSILTVVSAVAIIVGFILHGFDHGFANALIGSKDSMGEFPLNAKVSFSIAIIAGGWFIFPKAFYACKRLKPDMNLLMTIAVIGAIGINQWFEAATVTLLFSVALLLESWSVNKARGAIQTLLSSVPNTANVVCKHHGGIENKPVEEIAIGTTLIIKAGEKIPLDGVITQGETYVNQAPITGESMPVMKNVGDMIYAGSINQDGSIEIQVSKTAQDSTLAHIIAQVEQAQANRASTEKWVEKFAKYYTPLMILLAVLIILVPPLFFAGNWSQWIYEGLVILVIACPCALVISTPISIVAGLASAARSGVLIKGGEYLEIPSRLTTIAFDKTGTITKGEPVIQRIIPIADCNENAVLQIASALEKKSSHPLARAVLSYAHQRELEIPDAINVQTIKGKGVFGWIKDKPYWLGSHRFVHEKVNDKLLEGVHNEILQLESQGHSILVLGCDNTVCGVISIADEVKPAAKAMIQSLKSSHINTVLLTGDNKGTANAINEQCQFDEVYSELLPSDKVQKIQLLQAKGEVVGMVGDGINDSPALASANLGIAMGAMGSDAAIETADIALMSDDIERLPWLIAHSKRVLAIIKQNISFALIVKLCFIVLALNELATLWMAIGADIGASLLVIFNGLRLLKAKSLCTNMRVP
jgi:Cd2+/Zn2+-exporting ATPase